MYDSSELLEASITLITAQHRQRMAVMRSLRKTQLIADREHVVLLQDIVFKKTRLLYLIRTHELWGDLHTDEDLEANKEMQTCLEDLAKFCKVKNENVEGGTSPDESVQTLLRNLEFFALARELLELPIDEDDATDATHQVRRTGMFNPTFLAAANTKHLKTKCNQLLAAMVEGNADNKAQLLRVVGLDLLLDMLGTCHLASQVLFKIVRRLFCDR